MNVGRRPDEEPGSLLSRASSSVPVVSVLDRAIMTSCTTCETVQWETGEETGTRVDRYDRRTAWVGDRRGRAGYAKTPPSSLLTNWIQVVVSADSVRRASAKR